MLKFSKSGMVSRYTVDDDITYVLTHEAEQSQFVGSWTRDQHATAIKDPNIDHLIVEQNGQPIAYLILRGINDQHTLEFTRIIVSEPGKGFGREILQAVKRFAFEERAYNRLWLDVVHYNNRALELYLSEGFVLEGTLREVDFFNDQYASLHVLSILRREYQN